MNRIAVARLCKYTAEQLNTFYTHPHMERKSDGLHGCMKGIDQHTDRLMSMSAVAEIEDRTYFATFDEVKIIGNTAYCITRKRLNNRKVNLEHLARCKLQVGLLGAVFEKSSKWLHTVKKLRAAGFRHNTLHLESYCRVYVLEYDRVAYDILADEDKILEWAALKMSSANRASSARAFDLSNNNQRVAGLIIEDFEL